MKGMGFDETDITDVTTTSAKQSKSEHLAAGSAVNGKPAPTAGSSASRSSCAQVLGAAAADKKEKKGWL
jgi:hypothetical protein